LRSDRAHELSAPLFVDVPVHAAAPERGATLPGDFAGRTGAQLPRRDSGAVVAAAISGWGPADGRRRGPGLELSARAVLGFGARGTAALKRAYCLWNSTAM